MKAEGCGKGTGKRGGKEKCGWDVKLINQLIS